MIEALPYGGAGTRGVRRHRRRWRADKHLLRLVASLLITHVAHGSACADPARFWISTSNVLPSAPSAPEIPGVQGSARFLHIWAQPATTSTGAFDASTNPFKQLENFTLNLITSGPPVQFVNNSIVVYNPSLGGATKRFEFVHDSGTTLAASTGDGFNSDYDDIYGIYGLAGTIISGGPNYLGVGGAACHVNDPYCVTTANGSPAWLVASMAAQTLADSGSSDYRLHISRRGMNHAGETSSQLSVVFGADDMPVYNGRTDREVTLGGDTSDFTVDAAPVSAVTESHWSSGDGQWSQLVGGNAPSFLDDVVLDGGVITLSGSQQANKTTINGGRLQIDGGASLASDVAVNAGGAISGTGWVGANLALGGSLAVGANGPLRVAGVADLTGGTLTLAPAYTQPPGISDWMTILTAEAGIQGTLSTQPTQSLGVGYTLQDINYGAKSVAIKINATGLLGDYNGDLTVDAADYVVWRHGAPVIEDDYTTWQSNFGLSSAGGGGSAATLVGVPEPDSAVMLLIVVVGLVVMDPSLNVDRRLRF